MSEGLPTEHFEHAEHAEHAAHMSDKFITIVTMTIAILAVFSAGVGSLETLETSAVTIAKNEAVLLQNKATDNWNFFQAKSLKKNMYEIAAAGGGPRADEFARQAKRYDTEQKGIEEEAKRLEQESQAKLHDGEKHEHRHHLLTFAVTILHISIAIATIAIITRGKRWPWYGSIALGLLGLGIAGFAYLPLGGH